MSSAPPSVDDVLDIATRRQAAGAATVGEPVRPKLRHTDPGMRRVRLGLFAAALATFALLYAPQPLLPQLARDVPGEPGGGQPRDLGGHVRAGDRGHPAQLAVGGARAAPGHDHRRAHRGGARAGSAAGPSLPVLLAIRVLQGFALAGVPAVAMAYLAEEVERGSFGRAMGLFIAGNSIGGLAGRIVAGVLATTAAGGSRWPAWPGSR